MLINRDHPWLKGCKFFAVPDGTGAMKNLMAGADGAVANSPALSHLGMFPALTYVPASTQAVTFGNPAAYGFAGPSVTALCRARPDNIGGTNNETIAVQSSNAAVTAGFGLFFSNFGGSEVGWCFVIYGASGFVLANDGTLSATTGREVVAAGRWEANGVGGTANVFVNGVKGANQSTGGAITAIAADPIYVGRQRSGIYFDGPIAWTMIFDRALSDGEVARLSRDWEWPFWDDDGGEVYTLDTQVTYSTVSSSSDVYTVLSPVTYTTEVDALGSFGGDIVADPSPTGPVTYSTISRSSDQYIGGVPTLVFYTTVSASNSTFTANSPVLYSTLSYSRDRFVGLVDGRKDLVDTSRYRR